MKPNRARKKLLREQRRMERNIRQVGLRVPPGSVLDFGDVAILNKGNHDVYVSGLFRETT